LSLVFARRVIGGLAASGQAALFRVVRAPIFSAAMIGNDSAFSGDRDQRVFR
jgi:hypothetical protein